ncbi:MAG: DegT/DnrJ/EryC1/StrS aminotransferase family protein, partial [Candidatus Omnitrophota bacterium]
MKIPFHKPCITDRDVRAVVKCLRNGWLTMGNMTIEFENAFKKYVGSHYTVAVSSGTAALHLALEAIGLKEGDEVIVPAMTFTSTAEVVCYFKAKPVFVDIEKSTGNIDVSQIEKKITKRTKAIIPVDYAGQPADLNDIKRIANKNNLFIIVDAAHSLSSYYKGKRISRAADMTCFSFYATKTLTTGEGGMVATNNKRWAERIRIMRLHGISRDAWKRRSSRGGWYYEVVSPGYKYNISDMQSALGIEQLKKVDSMWR